MHVCMYCSMGLVRSPVLGWSASAGQGKKDRRRSYFLPRAQPVVCCVYQISAACFLSISYRVLLNTR